MQIDVGESGLRGDVWGVLLELTEASEARWVLVGGLMVQVYAMANGVPARPTKDIDLLVDLEVEQNSHGLLVDKLQSLGFARGVQADGTLSRHIYRRGTDRVDVLVAQSRSLHIRRGEQPRRNMFVTPGGKAAVQQVLEVTVLAGNKHGTLYVPEVLGAIAIKATASNIDKVPQRHYEDLWKLLACSTREDVAGVSGLSVANQRRIRRALNELPQKQSASRVLGDAAQEAQANSSRSVMLRALQLQDRPGYPDYLSCL